MTFRNYKAVILAAGLGRRMKSDNPKSSLTIGPFSQNDPSPVSFLERQIRLLKLGGVRDIAVVIGHGKETILELLGSEEVFFVENTSTDISQSGSLHSFQFAANSDFKPLDGFSHTLLMDADIIYEYMLIENFLKEQSEESSLLIFPRIAEDSEEVRVFGKGNQPALIGKGLKGKLTGEYHCLGEATGIVKFAPADHQLVKELSDWLLGNPLSPENSDEWKGYGPAKRATEHEELSQRLMLLNRLKCSLAEKSLCFMEVDFQSELNCCKKDYYPRILKQDHAKYPGLF